MDTEQAAIPVLRLRYVFFLAFFVSITKP